MLLKLIGLYIVLDIPCPADIVIAVDMCTCDERRFDQAKQFITELTDKLIPMSAYKMQKLRFSIVQFNELALTTTSLAEFDGPIRNFVHS